MSLVLQIGHIFLYKIAPFPVSSEYYERNSIAKLNKLNVPKNIYILYFINRIVRKDGRKTSLMISQENSTINILKYI